MAYTDTGVTIDPHLATTRKNIYAAGDVCGPYQFTHFAEYQARIIARNILLSPIFGLGRARADYRVVPWTTFTEPEVARVGLNEKEAAGTGTPYDVHRFPFSDLDRAILESEETGCAKVIAARSKGTILGATIIGAGAGELIHELALAMKQGYYRQEGINTKVIASRGGGTILGATVVGAGAGELIHEFALAMKQGIGLASLSSMIHVYPSLSQAVQRVGDAYMRTRLTDRARGLFSRLYAWQRRGV